MVFEVYNILRYPFYALISILQLYLEIERIPDMLAGLIQNTDQQWKKNHIVLKLLPTYITIQDLWGTARAA